jgi:uncharacterized protein YggE
MTSRRYKVKRKLWQITTLIAILLAAGWLLAAPGPSIAQAQDEEDTASPSRTISVSGTGQVSATPDLAVVSLGVQTQAEEASTAVSENNAQMQDVISALEDADVAQDDIQTQVIRLSPRYQQPSPQSGSTQQGPPELVGYTATNIVQVTVRELDSLGDILDSAVQAGANQIQGISFEVSDPSDLVDQAREAAWTDAAHKAQQLAELSDSGLGMVLTISETSRAPTPIIERAVGGVAAAAAVPVQPGTQTIEVDLQVTWLLTTTTSSSTGGS